jgi:hypothetical protein
MPVREHIAADLVLLGTSKVTIATAVTTNFDFGTPDDIRLGALAGKPGAGYKHGQKVLVVFTATSAGTTDTVSFSVQDAADNAGAIGTPAAADTSGTLTGGVTNQFARASVRVKSDRPWLRCRVTSTGATDTFVATCQVFAVPAFM